MEPHRPDHRRRPRPRPRPPPGRRPGAEPRPCAPAPRVLADPGHDDGPKLAADRRAAAQPAGCWWSSTTSSRTSPPAGRTFLDPAVERGASPRWPMPPRPGRCWSPAGTRCPARTGSWPRSRSRRCRRPSCGGCSCGCPRCADLDADDRRLLIRTIGGHPRLIEFTDALLRGGRASLRHVQVKLRDLAARAGRRPAPRPAAGPRRSTRRCCWAAPTSCSPNCSTCSPPRRRDVLHQVAVCRAPMTLDDLAFALHPDSGATAARRG